MRDRTYCQRSHGITWACKAVWQTIARRPRTPRLLQVVAGRNHEENIVLVAQVIKLASEFAELLIANLIRGGDRKIPHMDIRLLGYGGAQSKYKIS
ncbi:hypothetical protein D3C72_1792080 [compost metagenome]